MNSSLTAWLEATRRVEPPAELLLVSLSSAHTMDLVASSYCSLARVLPRWVQAVVVAWDELTHGMLVWNGIPAVLEQLQGVWSLEGGLTPSVFGSRGRPMQYLKFWVTLLVTLLQIQVPLLLTDADVWWLDTAAMPLLLDHCRDGSSPDVLTMQEEGSDYVGRANAGFILSCSTSRAGQFWRSVAQSMGLGHALPAPSAAAAEARLINFTGKLRYFVSLTRRNPDAPINDQQLLRWHLTLSAARGELRWAPLNWTRFGTACATGGAAAVQQLRGYVVFHAACGAVYSDKVDLIRGAAALLSRMSPQRPDLRKCIEPYLGCFGSERSVHTYYDCRTYACSVGTSSNIGDGFEQFWRPGMLPTLPEVANKTPTASPSSFCVLSSDRYLATPSGFKQRDKLRVRKTSRRRRKVAAATAAPPLPTHSRVGTGSCGPYAEDTRESQQRGLQHLKVGFKPASSTVLSGTWCSGRHWRLDDPAKRPRRWRDDAPCVSEAYACGDSSCRYVSVARGLGACGCFHECNASHLRLGTADEMLFTTYVIQRPATDTAAAPQEKVESPVRKPALWAHTSHMASVASRRLFEDAMDDSNADPGPRARTSSNSSEASSGAIASLGTDLPRVPRHGHGRPPPSRPAARRLEMVIAAYEESTAWITPLTSTIPNLRVRLYCKSLRMLDERCEYLPNIGQDHWVYLRYIVTHYRSLPDVVIFTMNGVLRNEWNGLLCRKLVYVLNHLDTEPKQHSFAGFVQMADLLPQPLGRPGSFVSWSPKFKLDTYRRGSGNEYVPLCLTAPRPLGRWYSKHIEPWARRIPALWNATGTFTTPADPHIGMSYHDIYAVSGQRLRDFPNETYAGLLAQVEACGSLAAEIDHYLERVVKAMFQRPGDMQLWGAKRPLCPLHLNSCNRSNANLQC